MLSKGISSAIQSFQLPLLWLKLIPVQQIHRMSSLPVLKSPKHPEHLRLPNIHEPHALEPASEDLSHVASHLQNTFNFAAYVNRSETLKKLINLGVDLSKIEKSRTISEYVIRLDFERDMQSHLFFLKDLVDDGDLGHFLSKNIMIFKEDLNDLEVRINYLLWKKFTQTEIKTIVLKNPFWLMFSTKKIDERLGYFQKKFSLSGAEVRSLTVLQPRIITYELRHIEINNFVVKEEMGFNDYETKKLILSRPKLWMLNQLNLTRRFDYVHNVMKISHERILQYPDILMCRKFRIEQRHRFLQRLGRAQYDPLKENYVSLKSMITGTDAEFCRDIAKCTVDDFNTFLKTL